MDAVREHTYSKFDTELERLRLLVRRMAQLVETQLDDSARVLAPASAESLVDQMAAREREVDQLQVDVDLEAAQIVARMQPTANDLRFVLAASRVASNLERIGDEALYCAHEARRLQEDGLADARRVVDLRYLRELVSDRFGTAMQGFDRLDAVLVQPLIADNEGVDVQTEGIARQLVSHMIEDPRRISTALRLSWVAQSLERVDDHVVSICEHVIYIVEGRDVRAEERVAAG